MWCLIFFCELIWKFKLRTDAWFLWTGRVGGYDEWLPEVVKEAHTCPNRGVPWYQRMLRAWYRQNQSDTDWTQCGYWLNTMWLDSGVEELYHGLLYLLIEGKPLILCLNLRLVLLSFFARMQGGVIISLRIFFPLSTLLVQVVRHRVSFSGDVDSKSMRLDWWSDWWVIYCRYNIELGGYWIWFFDAVIYSGFEFVTGPCPGGVKYVLVEYRNYSMLYFGDKCIRCRATAIKADMQVGGIKDLVLAACPMSRIVL